jgi:hypothetical protein
MKTMIILTMVFQMFGNNTSLNSIHIDRIEDNNIAVVEVVHMGNISMIDVPINNN